MVWTIRLHLPTVVWLLMVTVAFGVGAFLGAWVVQVPVERIPAQVIVGVFGFLFGAWSWAHRPSGLRGEGE